jgi:hypothetical protein
MIFGRLDFFRNFRQRPHPDSSISRRDSPAQSEQFHRFVEWVNAWRHVQDPAGSNRPGTVYGP